MKKTVAFVGLMVLVLGIFLAFAVVETRICEEVIDEWGPIYPSILYPYRNDAENKFNTTGYAFIDRAIANNRANDLKSLLEIKNILGLFLELNMSASNPVRVRVGIVKLLDFAYYYNQRSAKVEWINVIFETNGTYIDNRVNIEIIINEDGARANADFLEIENEGTEPVEISGNIKLVGKTLKPFYPYMGLGTLICFLGFSLTAYGFSAKPKKRMKAFPKNPIIGCLSAR